MAPRSKYIFLVLLTTSSHNADGAGKSSALNFEDSSVNPTNLSNHPTNTEQGAGGYGPHLDPA